MANTAYDTVTVTDSAAIVVPVTLFSRIGLVLANEGSVKIYVGIDDSVDETNGIPLYPSEKMTMSEHYGAYKGAIYAMVETGTADLRYLE